MFSYFIDSLKQGDIPDPADLRKRLVISLIKKEGVLRLPYHFWQTDSKINPLSVHMLWAAICLDDREGVAAVAECIRRECEETHRYKSETPEREYNRRVGVFLEELQTVTRGTNLQDFLQEKCGRMKRILLAE